MSIWQDQRLVEGEITDVPVYSGLLSELYDQSWYSKSCPEETGFFQSFVQDFQTLEIGSGTGRLTIPLLRARCNLYGVEGSRPMFGILREKLLPDQAERFILWNVQQTPFPVEDGAFGCIIVPFSTFGLVHNHVEDLGANKLFREFYRILQPGSFVVVNDFRVERIDRNQLGSDPVVEVFRHEHPGYGEIQEEQISEFEISPNRLFPDQIIRKRRTRLIAEKRGQVLETHFERIPLWDVGDYPVLGQDAGFEYVGGQECPDFYEEPSVMHIYRKP